MPKVSQRIAASPSDSARKGQVLTTAIIKAAEWLGVKNAVLSEILGLSQPTISRMKSGAYHLEEGSKVYELSTYFIRAYRSLFAIVGGDQVTARGWLLNYNTALQGVPLELLKSIRGINDVCAYLDARRAVI